MSLNLFEKRIKTNAELENLMGEPSQLVNRKVINYLDQHCKDFIAKSPFLVISTANEDGLCDASPRGDQPGFVKVLNDKYLIIPERPGNKRMDSLRNILANPRVGLLFMIPGLGETLRVNGSAQIIQDDDLLKQLAVQGKTPLAAIAVEAEECYIHCAKAFKRSGLWKKDTWPAPDTLPKAAKILVEHAKLPDVTLEEIEARLEESYQKKLY
ncbi:pyridoxamine 5'-phosphate oxidase family protein [Jeotgalibacillus proteolyticus]|uniref:Phosphohydrolase n=1 Tax=Jeotgalibacillus proteolyticus TaxID=2082395 RepID=A0A2S5GCK0_9BACL|nr:pyridoxamine 5'-phosphate oxidase family protein [Jeotgalibacillus proteolyticus]PPA70730.1 phosphohydrolase [Jeotgalibacillus proteolyticus]